jgi:hypothetical protein
MHSTTLRRSEARQEPEWVLAELVSVTYDTAALVRRIRRTRTQIALANALTAVLQSRGIAS